MIHCHGFALGQRGLPWGLDQLSIEGRAQVVSLRFPQAPAVWFITRDLSMVKSLAKTMVRSNEECHLSISSLDIWEARVARELCMSQMAFRLSDSDKLQGKL